MKLVTAWIDDVSLKHLMQLELLVAAALPVVAMIVLAAVGITHITNEGADIFIIAFVLCAVLAFFGEVIVILLIQGTCKKRLLELATTCRDYTAGDTSRRAWVHGTDELAILAKSLNRLLDMRVEQQTTWRSEHTMKTHQEQLVNERLEQLLRKISPAVDGDLRARAEVTSDIIGVVADTFNYLIDELRELVKRIQFASHHITSSTRDLLDRTVELAQHIEAQTLQLAHNTENVETIFASLQHITRMLQLSRDGIQKTWDALHLQEDETQTQSTHPESADIPGESSDTPGISSSHVLIDDMQKQIDMIEQASQIAQESTSAAEEMIIDLYTLSEHSYQFSQDVLKSAERIGALAVFAEQWRDTVAHFHLPEQEDRENQQDKQSAIRLGFTSS